MATTPVSKNKIVLMSIRGDLIYTARHDGFNKGDLKKLAAVFNKHGVKPATVIDHDDLPGADEFFVSIDAQKAKSLVTDIQKCKAVTKLEVL